MDLEMNKREKERLKRNKKLLSFLCLIIIILVIVFLTLIKKGNNTNIRKLGANLSEIYSKTNFEYLVKTVDNENENEDKNGNEYDKNYEYYLIKRLDDNVYLEINKQVKNEFINEKYYYDLSKDKAWKILDEEKIILTDEYIEYNPIILNNIFINAQNTFAENYALYDYNLRKPSEKILSLKSVEDKKINGKMSIEVKLQTVSGIEKTYFDKDTFLPYKTILENEKNGDIIKDIFLKFDSVTDEDFKIIEDYRKMTSIDYKEYQRVMEQ